MTSPRPVQLPAVSIIDAMAHPALFGQHFTAPSWAAWRAFLAALFALPLDNGALATFTACTGRKTAPTTAFKEAALICGRRAGKSRVLALIATFIACLVDHTPHLAAGEVATVAVICADRRQARTVMRYTLGLIRGTPALAALIAAETAESVTLTNRVQIEVQTASFKLTRGYTFAAVLADEIAFWATDDGSAAPDSEIIRAVRPGLSSLPGSMLLIASSPYAKRGVLWTTFKRHYGRDDARVLVWQAGTRTMNPTIDPAIIEEARETDPAAAAAEYDAQFRDDLSNFLPRDLIEAAIEAGRTVRPPQANHHYFAFADPSGGSTDAFTASVAHMEENVAVLDCMFEKRPPFSPAAVVADIAALIRSYRLSEITGDRYAAGWVVEAFADAGVTYRNSSLDRSEIYMNALPMFTTGRVRLLDHQRTARQFASLERRTGAGRDRVDHPTGGSDDAANAAAGALVLASRATRTSVPYVAPIIIGTPHVMPGAEPLHSRSLS